MLQHHVHVASKVVLCTVRPTCCKDRANAYDSMRRRSSSSSVESSDDAPLERIDTRLRGDLVDFQEMLNTFEERLSEPTVGTFMDTSAATSGRLYELRDDLTSRSETRA